MHSGYPIGAYISAVDELTTEPALRAEGSWGAFHELGLNHQWRHWTISRTTETGCNWWSIVMKEHLGVAEGHGAIAGRKARIHDWVLAGKPWNSWEVKIL